MDVRRSVIWSIAFLSLLLGIYLTRSGSLEKVDRLNTDIYHVLSGVRYQPEATVIASLDSQALKFYPNTPLVFWGPYFAKVIERLKEAGAASIAFDILFSVTPEQWLRTVGVLQQIPAEILDYDQAFDQALSEGRVILAANPEHDNEGTTVSLPAEEYLMALSNHLEGIGLTVLQLDSDARVRWMVPAFEGLPTDGKNGVIDQIPEGYKTPNPWWSFAALAVKEGYGMDTLSKSLGNSFFSSRRIVYCGPPKTIPRISLAAIFREQGLTPEEKSLVAGRIVFIGSDYEGFGDRQPTPYSRNIFGISYQDMSRVEIHANIAETILHPGRVKVVPSNVIFLTWAVIMILAVFTCSNNLKPIALHFTELLAVIFLWPLGYILFKYGHIMPQSGCLSSVTFFFITIETLRMICHNEHYYSIFKNIFGKFICEKIYNCKKT